MTAGEEEGGGGRKGGNWLKGEMKGRGEWNENNTYDIRKTGNATEKGEGGEDNTEKRRAETRAKEGDHVPKSFTLPLPSPRPRA